MNRLKLDDTGGLPFYQGDLKYDQDSYWEALTVIFQSYGDNFIISGCEYNSGTGQCSDGYIFLDGEILKVDAHACASTGYFNKVSGPASDVPRAFYDGNWHTLQVGYRAQVSATVSNLPFPGPNLHRGFQELEVNSGVAWDLKYGREAMVELQSTQALTITNAVAGDQGRLIVKQHDTLGGGDELTLPANSKVKGGTLSFSASAGDIDILTFLYDGTDFYWKIDNDFS